jgi:hypothetical protein
MPLEFAFDRFANCVGHDQLATSGYWRRCPPASEMSMRWAEFSGP